jgi:nucleoid DNA-binding protein
MKKLKIAREWAREAGVSQAEAADRLDRVVSQILAQLRKGGEAPLRGVGKFGLGAGGIVTFESEKGKRHE